MGWKLSHIASGMRVALLLNQEKLKCKAGSSSGIHSSRYIFSGNAARPLRAGTRALGCARFLCGRPRTNRPTRGGQGARGTRPVLVQFSQARPKRPVLRRSGRVRKHLFARLPHRKNSFWSFSFFASQRHHRKRRIKSKYPSWEAKAPGRRRCQGRVFFAFIGAERRPLRTSGRSRRRFLSKEGQEGQHSVDILIYWLDMSNTVSRDTQTMRVLVSGKHPCVPSRRKIAY